MNRKINNQKKTEWMRRIQIIFKKNYIIWMYSEQTENPKKLRVLFFVQFAGSLHDCKSYVRISLELFA